MCGEIKNKSVTHYFCTDNTAFYSSIQVSLERRQEHKVPIQVSPVVGFCLETLSPQLVDPRRRRGCSGWHHPTCQPPSQLRSQMKLPEKTHSWHEAGAAPGPCRTLALLPALPATAECCGAALLFLSSPFPSTRFWSPCVEQCSLSQKDSQRLLDRPGVWKINAALPVN